MLTVKEYKQSRGIDDNQWDRMKARAKAEGVTGGLSSKAEGAWFIADPSVADRFLPKTVKKQPEIVEAELVVEPVAIAPSSNSNSGSHVAIAQNASILNINIEAISGAVVGQFQVLGEALANKAADAMEQGYQSQMGKRVQEFGQRAGVVQEPEDEGD